jgi:hypothetical protein
MNGNIVGEPIDKFVQLQINARQSKQFMGYDYSRTSSELQYLNNKNAWVKLASSVRIDDPKYLTDIGIINPSIFSGVELAKKAILFNTLSSYTNDKSPLSSERAGIGKETTAIFFDSIYFAGASDVWNDTYAYGIGGSDFGIQPPPGIVSAQVDSINRGSIRKANITLKAHNKFQFDIIELLYLRLGFTMMLEWGWDRYLDSETGNIEHVTNTVIEENWFTANGTTQLSMLSKIKSMQNRYDGNYDGFFGRVSNFTWSFNPDGSYDISIDLITLGDIIESLKVNTLAKTVATEKNPNDITFKEGDLLFGTNVSKVTNVNTIGYFLYAKVAELTNNFSVDQNIISSDYNYYSITPKKNTVFEVGGGTTVVPITGEENNWSPQYYIRLGEFLLQLENLVVPIVKNGGNSFTSQITFQVNGNVMSYFPNQIPFDPRVCIFKPSLNSQGDMAGVPTPKELNDIPRNFITEFKGRTLGLLSNLYINFEFIAGLLVSNGGPDQELPLIKFLQDLCNGINSALGGVNKLEPIIKDDYIITIIDQTLSFEGAENFINMEVYGYNPNNQTSNFVKDIKFVSKISPQLASMISIGATATGNNTAEIDGTAFSKWSDGLTDRFSQNILEPKGLNNLQQQLNEQEKIEKQKEYDAVFERARDIFFNQSSRTIDIKAFQALDEKGSANIDLYIAELFGLENITLPFSEQTIAERARLADLATDDLNARRTVTDLDADIDGVPLTYAEYLKFALAFERRKKERGILTLNEVGKIIPENYALYLSLAFGGADTEIEVFTKSYTQNFGIFGTNFAGTNFGFNPITGGITYIPSFNAPSKITPLIQFRYFEFNETFITEGKAAYKNYITNLNNETFIENKTPSSTIGFIPLSFELKLDGISGIKIYNQLSINNEFLPKNYPQSLKFVITKVNHQISNNNWETALSTISIPRTSPYKFTKAPVILSNTGGGSGGSSGGVADPNVITKSLTTGIDLTTTQLDKSAYPNGVIYVPEETKKTMIFLHHTAGRGGAGPTIGWWRVAYIKNKKTGAKVPIDYPLCTHYIIDREGNVEYVFDEKYWAYHASSSTKVQKSSISVELSAYGWLVEEGDKLKNSLGEVVPLNEAALAVDKDGKPTPYRGYKYFDKYTDKQIEALKGLFTNWKNKKDFKGNPTNHSIDFKFNFDEMFPGEDPNLITKENPRGRILSQNAVNGIPGVYAHNSTAEYKVDVFPQAELVSMLKSVLAPN